MSRPAPFRAPRLALMLLAVIPVFGRADTEREAQHLNHLNCRDVFPISDSAWVRGRLEILIGSQGNPEARPASSPPDETETQRWLNHLAQLRLLKSQLLSTGIDTAEYRLGTLADPHAIESGALEDWFQAVAEFDGRGDFPAYASTQIRNRILDQVREQSALTRFQSDAYNQFEAAKARLAAHDEPTEDEFVYASLKWDQRKRDYYLPVIHMTRQRSLEDLGHHHGRAFEIPAPPQTWAGEFERIEFWNVLASLVENPEDRVEVLRYFRDGTSQLEIANELQTSNVVVNKRLKRATQRLHALRFELAAQLGLHK